MLVIGAVFVDVKGFSFGTYVPEGTNIGDVQIVPGGVCRNVAENLAKLGLPAQFVSMVDDTAMGRDVRDGLAGMGIDVTHVIPAERGMGVWMAILDEHGDLRGSISRQPDFSTLERFLNEEGEALIARTDGVVLELDMNPAIADIVMRLAVKHEKPIYVVVGNMGVISRHPEYLRRVACFICNEIEAGRLFGRNLDGLDPAAMLRFLPGAADGAGIPSMIVTMGSRGAVYYDSRTREAGICPALPCRLIDSTGAGDAFLSGAVMALTRGLPLSVAVRAGAKLASLVIQRVENASPPVPDFFAEFESAAKQPSH